MSKKVTEQQKPRLKLSDFYFADKHEAGTRMAIMLPNGDDSGEWLQVRGPDTDVSIKAGRAFGAAYRQVEADLKELHEKCVELKDFREWNLAMSWAAEDLNKQLAEEIVTGWSFDEPFSIEALSNLLNQFRGLAEAVAKHHTESREALSAK